MTAPPLHAPGGDRVSAVLDAAARRLAAAGVDGARRDARLLLAAVLECEPGALLAWPDRRLEPMAWRRFQAMVDARAERKPISRILGCREFWSLPFWLDDATLDPRPDSETLVEAALAQLSPDASARLLDLGTGSGCLLLSVLHERPNAWGLGVDRCERAVRTARRNAVALGLRERSAFVVGNWGGGLVGGFDAILVNPPYVSESEMAQLAPEVARYDPAQALRAGADGLDAYRALAPALPGLLKPGGFAAIEVGAGQARDVDALLRRAGLRTRPPVCDLAGIARCLIAASPA